MDIKNISAPGDTPYMNFFGVDSRVPANNVLQNNLTMFDWVTRNKIQPHFWGRNIFGENALTKEEMIFLKKRGCRIAVIQSDDHEKNSVETAEYIAKKFIDKCRNLGLRINSAIFLEIDQDEELTAEFMVKFAEVIKSAGYSVGFKANTDAKYAFDREYSRGMNIASNLLVDCMIWAIAPYVDDYNRITTSHLIQPEEWRPFAPSCTKRKDVAVWQYGVNCHPIDDDMGAETTFNVNLIINHQIIIKKMH